MVSASCEGDAHALYPRICSRPPAPEESWGRGSCSPIGRAGGRAELDTRMVAPAIKAGEDVRVSRLSAAPRERVPGPILVVGMEKEGESKRGQSPGRSPPAGSQAGRTSSRRSLLPSLDATKTRLPLNISSHSTA
jgi:hypothetical protein